MKRQLAVWQLINKSLVQNIPVMLLYVLESKGSSPGRQGFFMAVTINGEMQGSIGGGIMEHKFVEMAKEKLQGARDKGKEASIRRQFHDKSAAKNQSGMICSGEQTNFLYRVQENDLEAVKNLIESLEKNKNGLLQLSPAGLSFQKDVIPQTNFHFVFKSEDSWEYKEKTGYKNFLFIVGGGHCSLALSRIVSMMDFYIHLIDNRKGLHTFEENNYVHQKTTVHDYSEITKTIFPGKNHYVIVMTFGYRSDDTAIRTLLNKDFAFFGLLGSTSKIKKMLSVYSNEGISVEQLQKIYAPVGLLINSQTPEEIAISIAAQIILVKNRREKQDDQFSQLSKD